MRATSWKYGVDSVSDAVKALVTLEREAEREKGGRKSGRKWEREVGRES